MNHSHISNQDVIARVMLLYPLLKEELFMHYENEQLADVVSHILEEFLRQTLIIRHEEDQSLSLNSKRIRTLQLLAAGIRETLQRYTITLSLLRSNPSISRGSLEKESRLVAQRLSVLHGINAPEFFDKAVFSTLVATLKTSGYINDEGTGVPEHINTMYSMLGSLISPEIKLTIENVANE